MLRIPTKTLQYIQRPLIDTIRQINFRICCMRDQFPVSLSFFSAIYVRQLSFNDLMGKSYEHIVHTISISNCN